MGARALFEAELSGRGLSWIADPRPGRYMIGAHGMTLVVSLDNLGRQLRGDAADAERVASFTGQVIAAAAPGPVSAAGLYWLLEPSDYQAPAAFRAPVSPRLDRVLANVEDDGALIRWVTAGPGRGRPDRGPRGVQPGHSAAPGTGHNPRR